MKFIKQKVDKLFLLKPNLFKDKRGSFRRLFCEKTFLKKGINFKCVQTNISENLKKRTLRGFHFHKSLNKESKVISCLTGKIFLSVVDLRKKSKTYLSISSFILSQKNKNSIYVPTGCASAFLTLENNTVIYYLMSDYYKKENDKGFNFNSKILDIRWPLKPSLISKKDQLLPDLQRIVEGIK